MFEKFSRSWELVKASAGVLRSDKELMLFPLISGAATLVVMATFLVPVFALRIFEQGVGVGGVILGFLFYFCQYSVIIFFNCALVGAAMIRLDGGDPTLRDGFDAAKSRLPSILGYAAIAATVGVLLQGLKSRDNNFIVRLIGSGLGAAWTLATFLVVPVLVSRGIGPIDALKESVTLLRRTWGENAIGNVGIGAAFGLITFLFLLVGAGLTFAAYQMSLPLAIGVGVVFLLGVLLLGIYQAALSGVYSAALYRYAVSHEAPAAFRGAMLEDAFRNKA
ncbi:MAG: DUF6159 family protein [Pseudoxanthomonas sp.]